MEVDVRLSQDSIPVLYHDHTLTTMTNGTGCVSRTPAAQLTLLRYQGGWLYDWRQHERLITLETLLAALQKDQHKLGGSQESTGTTAFPYLHLDLHEQDACSTGDTARSRALARRLAFLLTRYHVPLPRVLVLTNRPATLAYLRQLLPSLPLGFEFTEAFEAGFTTLGQLSFVQAAVVHKDDISLARAARLHSLGREVVVFGGRSARAVSRVVGAGPDSYEVDNVRQLRATLRRQSRVGALNKVTEQ
ncbi:hypothetical protein GCM10011378_28240 [Hymenobacter glacieicola]|uniref:GP-PDE domain-containing protein n=1 Tax=Hymenobacter glacieicola TaxID=1562124 RepID=A0ABQ1X0Q7_9BACT|nr:hypothetical protein GCM10011378_28240 [Hymenobacter glacieicola]